MLTETRDDSGAVASSEGWLARALRPAWLGQTIASICWIASMFVYGIESGGDWLQLCAATSWLVANLAALANPDS